MKCKICGKNYICNKCAYDKHVDSHKMEPFKIRKFNDFSDQMREIENKNNLFIDIPFNRLRPCGKALGLFYFNCYPI